MPRAGDPPLLLFPKKLGNAWNNNSLAGPREREGRKKCDGGVETEAIFPIFATVGNTRGGVGSPFIGAVCLAWDLPKYQSPLANNIVYIYVCIYIYCIRMFTTRQFFSGVSFPRVRAVFSETILP